MPKAKMITKAIIAMFALSIITSSTASAAMPGWMIGGTQLTGSAALASTAAVDEVIKLSGGGVEVECTGTTINGISRELKGSNKGSASSIVITGCRTLSSHCTLSSTEIGTTPIEAEATLEGTLGIASVFTPKTGTTVATVKFNGESCPVAGLKAVTGKFITKSPEGQDEHTLQLTSINTAATEAVLKLGSSAARASGSALPKLASGLPWSFL
jgi:hypothetical protein